MLQIISLVYYNRRSKSKLEYSSSKAKSKLKRGILTTPTIVTTNTQSQTKYELYKNPMEWAEEVGGAYHDSLLYIMGSQCNDKRNPNYIVLDWDPYGVYWDLMIYMNMFEESGGAYWDALEYMNNSNENAPDHNPLNWDQYGVYWDIMILLAKFNNLKSQNAIQEESDHNPVDWDIVGRYTEVMEYMNMYDYSDANDPDHNPMDWDILGSYADLLIYINKYEQSANNSSTHIERADILNMIPYISFDTSADYLDDILEIKERIKYKIAQNPTSIDNYVDFIEYSCTQELLFGSKEDQKLAYSILEDHNLYFFEKNLDPFIWIAQDLTSYGETLILARYDRPLLNLFIYMVISFFVVCILLAIAYMCSPKLFATDKLSSYECGFSPFSDARGAMHINFYLFLVLFLIFDIELLCLLPIIYKLSDPIAFFAVYFFLILLIIGFIYEWSEGVLSLK
jgi:NADH-quinone oxidoreductase subunit A